MENAINNENIYYQERFDLVVAKRFNGELQSVKIAGVARFNEDGNYYALRLHMFPKTNYFLSKNFSNNEKYTIFSKSIQRNDGVRLQDPVGSGQILNALKTHLQIYFLMPRMTFYMSLFPKNM